MRTVIAAGFGLALGLATATSAFAGCMGHEKQQSVQAPTTSSSTTADTATTGKPRG